MDYKSSTLLNAIRNGASQAYKDRIPEATEANLAEVGSAIFDYEYTRNEFASMLLNKISLTVLKNKGYENPLKEFKRGMLPAGSTIEEIFVELVTAQTYDPALAESTLYKRNLPDIRSLFHVVNREDVYPTTVQGDTIVKAFTTEAGAQGLIAKIVESLYTSDELDEFLIMKGMVQRYRTEGKFWPVVITAPTNEATAKAALTKMREVSNNMTFMRKDYNFAGVAQVTPKANQIVLLSTAFDALVDVEVLAAAFNMDKADFIGRRVLVDDFGGSTNMVAAIVDKDWFMAYDKLIAGDNVWNALGRYFNYFYHHQGVYSVSPFENTVAFVTAAPTISALTVHPTTETVTISGTAGGTIQLSVEATGTNNPPIHCTWASDTDGVTVNSQGFVTVPKNHGDDTVTITATSKFNTSVSTTFIFDVGAGA
jgi:hypothetical protein